MRSARREFEADRMEVVGFTEHDNTWSGSTRAPDGNLYEFASRLPEAAPEPNRSAG